MTDNIKNYRFDFATEAQKLADFIGTRADKIVFVEVGFDRDHKAFAKQKLMDDNEQELRTYADAWMPRKLQKFNEDPGYSSYVTGFESDPDDHGQKHVVGAVLYVNKNQNVDALFGKKDQDLQNLFTLYHELTHAIALRDYSPNSTHPENLGDALAALFLLHRFGQAAVPFLENLSMGRANMALQIPDGQQNPDVLHLSTLGLDNIIADSQHEDFTRLSAEQLMQRANEYAAKYMPDNNALGVISQVAQDVVQNGGVSDQLANDLLSQADASRSSPVNMALYVAAKNATYDLGAAKVTGRFNPIAMSRKAAQALIKGANKLQPSALYNPHAREETGIDPPPAPAALPKPSHPRFKR
jgi:hypothetical protein